MFRSFISGITITCEEIGNCANKTSTLDQAVVNIGLIITGLIGGLSIVFILWGSFRYVISRGDSGATKAAKETILYAVLGIIVAILAYALVSFIALGLGKSS